MRIGLIVLMVMAALAAPAWSQEASSTPQVVAVVAPDETVSFQVYADKYDSKNHYIPSGWMGDYGDIAIDDGWAQNPHSGRTCIKLTYSAKGSQGAGWMGIYWQNPPNNWGSQKGGYDLSKHKKLTFWARGDKGGEVISEFKIGGINGTYADTDAVGMGPVTLTKDWKEYTIDLGDADLGYISGGFQLSARASDNPGGSVIYLDDINYK